VIVYARVTTSLVRDADLPEAPEILERAIEELRGTDGFRGLLILARNEEGASVSITLWEDEESVRASGELAARLRVETERFGRVAQTVETFPVVAFET
jgi:heme-degrading monooxygenase HmoA